MNGNSTGGCANTPPITTCEQPSQQEVILKVYIQYVESGQGFMHIKPPFLAHAAFVGAVL